MFLKETKVLNYKSFRHKIQVQNFSPGFNILIGLNGSGKSTFLEVVTLLFLNFKKNPKDKFCPVNNFLSDPFKKVFSIVQISIENSDRKIPLPKNVITIRRIIGRNLDKFLIFNQSLSPQQFFSFLDSLGFCRENFILQMKQGEQTKFKDLKSLARLDAIQNLIGGGVYSRFKVKAITLLKNIVFYKKKISQEVAKIKERVSNLSFNEPTPPKKKLIRATCFIFEKNCRKNFEEFTQGKLKKLKIERFDKSVFNLIFWGRNFVKKKKTFYIRLSNNQSFFNFSEKNFFSKRKFFCADTDCLRLRQLELNFKFSKIQKLEKIWEGKITTFNPFKMFLEFPLKKKRRNLFSTNLKKIKNIQKYVSKIPKPRFFLEKKNILVFRNIWDFFFIDFFKGLFHKNSIFKFKAFKIRQRFSSILYTMSKEIEKSKKNLENFENKLTQLIGNKTFYGIQVILKILKLSPRMKTKVLGLFFDLFSVHRFFFHPIENFLGKILTHIVVENRETAFYIIQSLQKGYLVKGNFLLLEKEKFLNTPEIFSSNFFPIIFAIFFRPRLSFLLKSFFNTVFLSKDPFRNIRTSKNLKVHLLTLEGEIFYSNGIISYGNKRKKNSIFQIVSTIKKERKVFEWFIEKEEVIKKHLSFIEERSGKIFLFFFISNKLSKFFLNRAYTLKRPKIDRNQHKKNFFHRYSEEKSFTIKVKALKIKKFSTDEEPTLFNTSKRNPFKKNPLVGKSILVNLGRVFFFHPVFYFGNIFIKDFKLFQEKKNSKKYPRQTQLGLFITYREKFKPNKLEKLFEKTRNIEERIIPFTIFLTKKFFLEQLYIFFEKIFKEPKKLTCVKTESINIHGFFSKKENAFCFHLLEHILRKKIKIQNNKNRENHLFIRNQLFDLTNYSKEIDSDLFITGQILEVLLKKKHKKLKKTLLSVSKNFNQIFKTALSDGKSCIILENKKFPPNLTKKKRNGNKKSGCDIFAKFEKKGPFFFLEQMSNGQASLVSIILLLSIGKALQVLIYIFDEADANLDSKNCLLLAFLFKKFSSFGIQFLISTFRKEMTGYGDKWFGIAFSKHLTKIKTISKLTALKFTIKKNDY